MAGSRLKALREARGLSGAALARLSGVPQPMVSRFERSTMPKGLASALAIAAVLRVKVTDIWPEADPKRHNAVTQRCPARPAVSQRQRARTSTKNQRSAKTGGNG